MDFLSFGGFVFPLEVPGELEPLSFPKLCAHTHVNRAFSLTLPESMLICWNKRKHLHEKRVELPEDFLGTPTRLPFHCFGTPIWPP